MRKGKHQWTSLEIDLWASYDKSLVLNLFYTSKLVHRALQQKCILKAEYFFKLRDAEAVCFS